MAATHAPNAEQLWDWRWLVYRERYLERLRQSYVLQRSCWDKLLARERAVVVCYCAEPERCHRSVLAEVLVKLGAQYGGELAIDGSERQRELWSS